MPEILLDHFYKINSLDHEDNDLSVRITFDAKNPVFEGHFPGMPVVPGVCQVQILTEVLGKAHSANLQMLSAATIKFLALIDPVVQPQIDLIISVMQKEDGNYSVSAQYKWEEKTFFKFKGVFTAAK